MDEDNQKRRTIARKYRDGIKHSKIILPAAYDEMAHVWHIFAVRTPERDSLQQYLSEKGIQTNIHYPTPPHKQGAYQEFGQLSLPVTEKIHREVLSLPISPVMTEEEVDFVIQTINQW